MAGMAVVLLQALVMYSIAFFEGFNKNQNKAYMVNNMYSMYKDTSLLRLNV